MSEQIILRSPPVPAKPVLSLLTSCYVERGTKADWDVLHELHYKAEKMAFGPHYWRCVRGDELVGVVVLCCPSTISRGRNKVFPHMKPGAGDTKTINQGRMKHANTNYAVLSRFVLDTMYRGSGAAARVMNLVMRMSGEQTIEFQSSMSKMNPFASHAGVQFTAPDKNPRTQKAAALLTRWFACYARDLAADKVGLLEELEAMPKAARAKCEKELRAFYYKNSSKEKTGASREGAIERVNAMPTRELIAKLVQLAFSSPLYGIYNNPDHGRVLPARLPLLAFDNQRLDEPLVLL